MKRLIPEYQKLYWVALILFTILVFIQFMWFFEAVKVEQEKNQLVLKQLISELALAIDETERDSFHGKEKNLTLLNLDRVDETFNKILESHGVQAQTYYAFYDETDTENFVSNADKQAKVQLLESDMRFCMSCIVSFSIVKDIERKASETEEEYTQRLLDSSSFQYFSPVQNIQKRQEKVFWLSLFQPHAFKDAVLSLIPLFLWSLFLLVILSILSFYLIRLLLNQKKSIEVKNDFFNNMTHEFKTPLSSIRLASRMLKKNIDEDKKIEYSNLIERESKRLEMQIDQLLELSMIDQNNIELDKESIDIHELISNIPKRMRPFIEEKGATLELKLNLKDSIIIGDEKHLYNCLSNLVENSLKYSSPNVLISIETKSFNNKKVITVSDNGPGIKKEHQNHLFNRFYRGISKNEYLHSGFGIGLSYVKSIIEQHGGIVYFNNEYTNGAQFIIEFK